MDPDEQWVRQAQAGSDAAFARLVTRHQSAVRGFLRRVLGGGWAEADDVAQEVFLAAWRNLRGLKDPAGMRAWLLGIAWRRAQDRIRAGLRSAARDAAWLETRATTGRRFDDERLALNDAMAQLAPDARACVALCLGDGWSHAEAAEALGLPLGTVKSHVARGRARLLEALGGSDDG
ncbi:MAG: sigma-70 family RNA polymerase sigma factor [Brevundimonas sp.]|uniref:RNA polymerase sigma factor n=1 Tax=Brevundimonas sp. TaxID=1871086 RepID=UPI0025C0E853|nr:sigma-70 family RNA polymerase sigma factor [Brevundimonas sp.]MBX3476411.1 sigma-70 family RNA polymerase sigma factor [Brevundimonas sp.]